MKRVVVVGAGMVGARFAEDLVRADVGGGFDVTLVGEEPYEPYNRVLLSDVLSGRTDLAAITLPVPASARCRLLRGVRALQVDRGRRVVVTDSAGSLSYDVLVLATGARALIPPLEGLQRNDSAHGPQLAAGVYALRSVDDCRDVVAAALNARAAVVVGGGLLGVEAACGLRARGVPVTLVHQGETLLDRQLGTRASAALQDAATDAGLHLELGVGRTGVQLVDGRVRAVRLDGERTVPADLVLLACGTVPDVALARAAGLTTRRGVVVDDRLASPDDPAVFAIGDCAEPAEGSSGLVAQGWQQSARLARHLTGGEGGPPVTHEDVVRLKASGLDVVTMGPREAPGRTVVLSDPDGRRHVEITVDGDRIVAASCVGAGALAADLVTAFGLATPVPLDPAALLVKPAPAGSGTAATSPTLMPGGAVVCRCNGVTKADIVSAWESGADDVAAVSACTRAGTGCGTCRPAVQGLLGWLSDAEPDGPSAATSQPARSRGEADVAPG